MTSTRQTVGEINGWGGVYKLIIARGKGHNYLADMTVGKINGCGCVN